MTHRLLLLLACLLVATTVRAQETAWKAGVASAAITPRESMWMAGYASRNKPSEGQVHELYAKALALEDAAGTRLVLVTTDLIGIPRELRDWLEAEVNAKFQIAPAGLLLNASHTHCGPELRVSKASVYGLEPERVRQSQAYADTLKETLSNLVGQAIAR